VSYALGRTRGRRTLQTGDLFPSAAWTGISSIDEPALQVNLGVTDLADSAVTHTVYMPSSYDPEVPAPLVILLHGYNGIGDWPRALRSPLADQVRRHSSVHRRRLRRIARP